MANKRIVDLPMAESINDEDILHIIQDGVDKQASASHVSGKVKDVQNKDGETLVNEDGVAVIKSETISGTRAEINAKILSGEIQDGDNYIVTDEDGIYQPADLEEIRQKVDSIPFIKSAEASGTTGANGVLAIAMPSNRIVLGVVVKSSTAYYSVTEKYSNGYYFCFLRLDDTSATYNAKVKNTNVTFTYYYIDL